VSFSFFLSGFLVSWTLDWWWCLPSFSLLFLLVSFLSLLLRPLDVDLLGFGVLYLHLPFPHLSTVNRNEMFSVFSLTDG